MGNKSRPGNEFTQRVFERQRETAAPPVPPKGPFPELRIIQDAVIDCGEGDGLSGDEYVWQWERFIANIGRKNKGKIIARSLGSVSMTIVSAQEISKMMEKKHGERFRRREEARKLLQGLAGRTREFLYEKQKLAIDDKEHQLYSQRFDEAAFGDFSFSSEIDDDLEPSVMTAPRLTLEQKVERDTELRRHLFGESVYYLPQIDAFQPFGRGDAWGIDLSANSEASDYRDALKTYFRRDEDLDIGQMDPSHRPHAVLFNLHPHINPRSFKLAYDRRTPPPPAMTFDAIRLDASGDDDILFA